MKRLYDLTHSIDCAEGVSRDMHKAGVRDWNFHIMSRDKKGLTKHHLHSTNTLIHERDVIRIGERGAIIGVAAGLCATISFLMLTDFIPIRMVSEMSMLFFSVAFGVIGALLGALLGLALENAKIKRFHGDLDAGNYLIMIDIRKRDAPKIEKMMSLQRGAVPAGDDTSIISPFQEPSRT